MNVQGRVSYYLSEQGRRESIRQGGDGKRQQSTLGTVQPQDLELFAVDEDGGPSLDATTSPTSFEADNKHHSISESGTRGYGVEWDAVPSWDDLIQFARWAHDVRKKQELEDYLEWESEQAAREQLSYAFLADPNARADKISEDYVTIAGHDFWSSKEPAVVEAKARSLRDHEELKKANRATLADWVGRHGTENQRERLIAGLLPWKEAYDAAEAHLYAPLSEFPLYKRFDIEEVCECVRAGVEETPCKVKFQSVDAVELTAQEWDQFSKIRKMAPVATFQLREHRAQCQIAPPQIRRGVIVKFSLGNLNFKRELALSEGLV